MSEKPVIIISHSEVESFLSCRRKHFYAFGDSTFGEHKGLEPTTFSDSLFRGICGHEALMVFFQSIQKGMTAEASATLAYERLQAIAIRPEVMTNANHMKIVTDLYARILPRFFEQGAGPMLDKGWFPVHVEETFRLELDFPEAFYVYPFTPDVILRDAAGNLWVWDHKFVYNFYTQEEINLLPQIPKYIGALRANGKYIKGGYYNFIRWREVKDMDKHILQVPFVPNDTRVKNAFRQQYEVMVEIGRLKLGSLEEWEEISTRVLSGMVCKHCSFKRLCAADLSGQETELMRRVEFRGNSYGYSATAEAE